LLVVVTPLRSVDKEAKGKKTPFDPSEIPASVVRGDLERALDYNKVCVAVYREGVKKIDANGSEDSTDAFFLAYHLLGQAQLNAMIGDLPGAAKNLREADNISHHPSYAAMFGNSPLADGWQDIFAATKGFVLEKSGRSAEAKQAYLSRPSYYSLPRLGILAVNAHNESEATKYVQQTFQDSGKRAHNATHNPTAHIVLAMLHERIGKVQDALLEYENALKYMEKGEIGNNQFLPIVVAEAASAKSGRLRLSSK